MTTDEMDNDNTDDDVDGQAIVVVVIRWLGHRRLCVRRPGHPVGRAVGVDDVVDGPAIVVVRVIRRRRRAIVVVCDRY